MQFKSFHWLSHYGIGAIIPCTTNVGSICIILGAFLYVFYVSSMIDFEGVFNKTIALVGYEMSIANSALHASLAIYHLMSNACSWNCLIIQGLMECLEGINDTPWAQGKDWSLLLVYHDASDLRSLNLFQLTPKKCNLGCKAMLWKPRTWFSQRLEEFGCLSFYLGLKYLEFPSELKMNEETLLKPLIVLRPDIWTQLN